MSLAPSPRPEARVVSPHTATPPCAGGGSRSGCGASQAVVRAWAARRRPLGRPCHKRCRGWRALAAMERRTLPRRTACRKRARLLSGVGRLDYRPWSRCRRASRMTHDTDRAGERPAERPAERVPDRAGLAPLPDFPVRLTAPDLAPWREGNIGIPGVWRFAAGSPGPAEAPRSTRSPVRRRCGRQTPRPAGS